MNEKKDEITKRRKIRKTLLLKINDELKEISESKPTLLINSKTIQEIEKVYNKNNILLSEKGTIYSNYVKTCIKIYPPCIKPIVKFKSVEKKNDKSKIKLEIVPSYDEEILSPILNFIPIKKNLYYKQLTSVDKRYTKNNGSIQKFIENNLNNTNNDNSLSKEDLLNQSTKIEKNNLMKLIAKILSLKDNENMEEIIKKNIKKLRKYCYRFRKKKKKNKRYKSQDNKIKNNNNNSIINSNNNNSNSNNLHVSSKKLNSKNNEKEKEYKNSHFKVVPKGSSKRQKNYLSLKPNKRASIKLKTLNDDEGKKLIIKLHKMKPIKTENDLMNNNVITINTNCNNDNEEAVPNIFDIKKELMRSSINERHTTLYDMHNYLTNVDKIKVKNSRKGNKKKIMIRKASLFQSKEIEKLKLAIRKDKKDKIELHDNLLMFKSNKKLKKLEINKHENKNRNGSFAHKIKKLNVSPKKSKKKLIESPEKKIDYYSNCNTYYCTNVFNLTQSADDKNNKMYRRRIKNEI